MSGECGLYEWWVWCCSEEWLYVCHVAVRSGYTYVMLQ